MLEAIFTDTTLTVTLSGLTQYDYGQKLYIKGLNLPEFSEVHFSNTKEKEAIVRVATTQGEYAVVDIPNVLLEKSLDITAWVYVVGDDSGETIRTIYLKVEPRIKPADFATQDPDAEDLLEKIIEKLNKIDPETVLNKNGDASNTTSTFTQSSTLTNLVSGETLKSMFGKIAKAIADLIAHLANKSNPHQVTKAQVGLGNVDNTADLNKPISTATQTALDGKANATHTHSKDQVGLANVDDTSDLNKPISTATQSALDGKASVNHTHTPSQVGLGNVVNELQVKKSEMGQPLGVATLGSDGKVPSTQLPSYVDDVLEYATKNDFPATGENGKIYIDTTTNLTYRWSGSTYAEISPSLALGETSTTAYAGHKGKQVADLVTNILNGTTAVPKAEEVENVTWDQLTNKPTIPTLDSLPITQLEAIKTGNLNVVYSYQVGAYVSSNIVFTGYLRSIKHDGTELYNTPTVFTLNNSEDITIEKVNDKTARLVLANKPPAILSGTEMPTVEQGNDGDIYIMLEE